MNKVYLISREDFNLIKDAEQLIMTARIGDGHVQTQAKNSCVAYSSILQDYIQFKHDVLVAGGYACSDVKLRDNSAGYNKKGIIYYTSSHVDERINKYAQMPRIDIIKNLDYFGFLLYFFDDGAYHKAHATMHIYCNSFSTEEVIALKQTIFRLFPIKECRDRVDKKKDGRQYPYLYVPVDTVKEIIKYYKEFVENEPLLQCMLYKLGLPSQTIKSNKCNSLTGE